MPRYAVRDEGLAMVGFTQLNKALARIGGGKADYGLAYELQRRLRIIGELVAAQAPQYVTHKYGRHGDASNPTLEESVRVAVTTKYASVYSTALHGGVQNVGGGPKAGWAARGPHVTRAAASKWMIQAVQTTLPLVEAEMQGLLDWLEFEFNAA